MIITAASFAALAGSVSGIITDTKTGEGVIGANVIITGTTTGTVTDYEGKFKIDGISSGKYSFSVSCMSYEPKILADVEVNGNVVLNFTLAESSIGINEVSVTTQRIQHTEAAMVSMQRKSASMLDGISAQEMSLSGSGNAASSLSKVTGVTVQDGKYVYVRGLGDRYLKTQLNGAEIPSLDPNRNTVQMDIFPSNIIDNLTVHKTFSPELPASFTGGYVNITTKDFPEKFTLQVSASTAFNPQVHFNKNYLTYEGSSTDKLGYDNGARSKPSEVAAGPIPDYPKSRDEIESATASFNKNMTPSTKMSGIDQSYSIAIGNKFKLGGRDLGIVASISYSDSYGFYENGQVGRYELNSSLAERLDVKKELNETKGSEQVLIGTLISTTYKLNGNNKVGINLIRNQSGISSAQMSDGYSAYHDVNMMSRKMSYLQRSFSSAQILGEHRMAGRGSKLKWMSSMAYSLQDEPDTRYFNNIYEPRVDETTGAVTDTMYSIEASKDKLPARYFRGMDELNTDSKVDYSIPVGSDEFDSKISFGGEYMYSKRNFTEILYEYNDKNMSYNGDPQAYLSDANIGRNSPTFDPNTGMGYGVYINEVYVPSNNYKADMTVVAEYLMADINLSEKFRVSGGARVEYCNIGTVSENPDKGKGKLNNTDLLPAVNFTYHPAKNTNLKIAATRTVARPSFREISPFASYDYQTGDTEIGNPDLKRTTVSNFDIRLEQFFGKGEIISIGYFYKSFVNPIERVFSPKAVNPEITFENSPNAKLHGIEIEIRKDLNFIHSLRNVNAGSNITLVTSTVQIEEKELESIRATAPGHPDGRTMTGQAPYIVNGFVRYHSDPHRFDAGLTYNITGPQLYMVIKGGTPNVFEMPVSSLDFNAKKEFGKGFSVKFGAKNIINQAVRRVISYKGEDYTYSSHKKGITYSVGLSYLIK